MNRTEIDSLESMNYFRARIAADDGQLSITAVPSVVEEAER